MITIESVSKTYRDVKAVVDATFEVPPGLVTGFVGPNGAGKTTMLKVIVGLAWADAGRVLVNGESPELAAWPASSMGVFLSAEWLPAKMTPRSLLSYVCRTHKIPIKRIDDLLVQVGLDHVASKRIETFSLGMRQRLGIAAAMITEPQIMIFDEPVNGLDPDGILWFRTFIQKQAVQGSTILLSSHHMSELSLIADRVVMIRDGRIVTDGTIADFTQIDTDLKVYIETDRVQETEQLLTENGFNAVAQGKGLCVTGGNPADISRAVVMAGHGLLQLAPINATLEQSYFDRLSTQQEKAV